MKIFIGSGLNPQVLEIQKGTRVKDIINNAKYLTLNGNEVNMDLALSDGDYLLKTPPHTNGLAITTLLAIAAWSAIAYGTYQSGTRGGKAEDTDVFDPDKFTNKGTPTQKDLDALKEYILLHGDMPHTDQQWKELGDFWEFSRNRNDEWRENLELYGEHLMKNDPEIAEQIIKEDPDIPDYYWDEAKIHMEGTKEHDLFDFYKQFGEAQHEAAQTELARSERDMQVEMAGQRTQLVDEVRKRRQNQLRSGLSSAQIANEEIQMLLMGQQAQQQTAQQHFDARTQMNQQHQLNPFMAEQQARQHIQGGMQGQSAFYASGVVDPFRLTQQRAGLTNRERSLWDEVVDRKDE